MGSDVTTTELVTLRTDVNKSRGQGGGER